MKKTLITLLAMSSVAMATTKVETIVLGLTGTSNPWGDIGDYKTHAHGTPNQGTANATIITGGNALFDYSMTHNLGRTFGNAIEDTWNNDAALTRYNEETGYALTRTQLVDGTFSASAGGGSYETFTLNFAGKGSCVAGANVTIYAFTSAIDKSPADGTDNNGTYNSFTVTGLTNQVITLASSTGSGFAEYKAGNFSPKGQLTIVRITGALDDNLCVTMKGSEAKTGFAAVTVLVPEPTTASLSLLALAGLAARRRRK